MKKEIFGDIFSMFIGEKQEDVEKVLSLFKSESYPPSNFEVIFLDEKEVNILSRNYFLDDLKPDTQSKLSLRQKNIFNCLGTTQSDGYKREECLGNIITNEEPYVPYFVLRALGGPVTYTQDLIYKNIDSLTNDVYRNFIANNPEFYFKIKNRVMSYWSEYRRDTTRKDYVGFKILERFDELVQP